jgi:hypothetical protein
MSIKRPSSVHGPNFMANAVAPSRSVGGDLLAVPLYLWVDEGDKRHWLHVAALAEHMQIAEFAVNVIVWMELPGRELFIDQGL